MIWRPILMTDDMAQAAFEGRKTQTRRPIKGRLENNEDGSWTLWRGHKGETNKRRADAYKSGALVSSRDWLIPLEEWLTELAPWKPGDGLYVRECWGMTAPCDLEFCKAGDVLQGQQDILRYDCTPTVHYRSAGEFDGMYWRPSIHMPKWAARTWLKNNSIWAERLHDITEAGARAEGFKDRAEFLAWWRTAYKDKPWAEENNPWVYVDDFHKTTKPSEL
jgi:hypothetical protein